MLLDVDGFDAINHRFGHAAGELAAAPDRRAAAAPSARDRHLGEAGRRSLRPDRGGAGAARARRARWRSKLLAAIAEPVTIAGDDGRDHRQRRGRAVSRATRADADGAARPRRRGAARAKRAGGNRYARRHDRTAPLRPATPCWRWRLRQAIGGRRPGRAVPAAGDVVLGRSSAWRPWCAGPRAAGRHRRRAAARPGRGGGADRAADRLADRGRLPPGRALARGGPAPAARRGAAAVAAPAGMERSRAAAGAASGGGRSRRRSSSSRSTRRCCSESERGGQALASVRELGVRVAVEGYGAARPRSRVLRDLPLTTVKLARRCCAGSRTIARSDRCRQQHRPAGRRAGSAAWWQTASRRKRSCSCCGSWAATRCRR